jgi:rhomboid protease GluP
MTSDPKDPGDASEREAEREGDDRADDRADDRDDDRDDDAPQAAPLRPQAAAAPPAAIDPAAASVPSSLLTGLPNISPPKISEGSRFHDELARYGGRAWVTPSLVVANVAIFAIMILSGVSLMNPTALELLPWGADYGPLTLGGEPWRLLANAFLHFGLLHVALNMYALWQVGRLTEKLFHPFAYLALYLAAAIGGSVASLVVHPFTVSAGASGAVFGVYGALLAYLIRQSKAIPSESLRPLQTSTIGFVGYNLVFGLTQAQIDNSAHIGGLVTGFLCGLVLARPLSKPPRLVAAALALVAAVGLAIAVLVLRPAPPDYLGALQDFTTVEDKAIKQYNDALGRAKESKITDAEMADLLETQILPPWQAMHERFDAMEPRLDKGEQAAVAKLATYMKVRGEAWRLFAKALHSGVPGDLEAATAQMKRADTAVELLKINEKK